MSDAPRYTPEEHGTGIVHIGPGAFHRAHQAVYTDDVLARHGGDWRIEGVSLRSTAVADALNAQGGRYTLVIRGDGPPVYRPVHSISRVHAATRGMEPVMAALARPATRIVSLTVTEKAYADRTEDGVADILARALHARRGAGHDPFTVLSCDNLPHNGAAARKAVLQAAHRIDAGLATWIDERGAFPSTMVDRITPAGDADLPAEVARATGFADHAPVVTEPFSQWVVEDDFACGRPAWQDAGVLMVADVVPFERMKLRMLNGAHSMLAYAGFLSGHTYVRDAMASPELARLVARHVAAAARTLGPLDGIDFAAYAEDLLRRFRNPQIAHETRQIAVDGSQKMPQRIFDPAIDALDRGHDTEPFAFATAAWLRYLGGRHDDGRPYALCDPREDDFAALADLCAQDTVDAVFALPDLVPRPLACSSDFRRAVAIQLETMRVPGMVRAIEDGAVSA